MWSPKQQVLRLARSLRRARSIELPDNNEQAVPILMDVVVSNQYTMLIDLLANSSFDVSHTFGRVQRTFLHIAANCGHFECVNVLLRRGCNPDIQDIAGSTALHLAARNGKRRCVEKLLEFRANVDIAGNDGATALHWLAVNGRDEILKLLLQYNSDVNLEDGQGHTALHAAARNGHTKAMECLIEAGADINYKNSSGITPLHSACTNGQRHAITLLLSKGVLMVPNSAGQTPIDLCMMGGYGVATELLLNHSSKLVQEFVRKAIYQLNFDCSRVNDCMKYFSSRALREKIATLITSETSDVGFQLLSVMSDKDVILQNLKRASLFLSTLCMSTEMRYDEGFRKVFGSFENLWQSVNDWLYLLGEEIDPKYDKIRQENDQASKLSLDCDDTDRKINFMLPKMAERVSALMNVLYQCLENQKRCGIPVAATYFHDFVCRHIDVLRRIVKLNPKVIFNHFNFLFDDSDLMKLFLDTIQSQPFSDRCKWFYDHLRNGAQQSYSLESENGSFKIHRENVFEDSCSQIQEVSSEMLKRNLTVQFVNEEGVGDGVLREWFSLLSNEILNPEYCLFTQSSDGCTFQPCSNSAINPDHLSYFKFAGRILGLALYHHQLVNVSFTLSFYKHLLGTKVSYEDVASIDPEYAKNLQWILDNDVTDLGLELNFLVETDVFGVMEEIELKPNGANIPVTEQNKNEYVQLVTELRMTRAIEPQIDAFMEGFGHFIPRSLIQIFSEKELDLLISGSPKTNVEDWKKSTSYGGNYSAEHPVIIWFWQCVESMSDDERSLLIQFCTGRSRLPLIYLEHSDLKFMIAEVTGHEDQLPTASTCMNMLKLPSYKSYEALEEKIKLAIQFGSFGYAFT